MPKFLFLQPKFIEKCGGLEAAQQLANELFPRGAVGPHDGDEVVVCEVKLWLAGAVVMKEYVENQQKISEWALATFGPATAAASIIIRAKQELDELLLEAVQPKPNPAKLVEEASDVYIVLCRAAERLKVDWLADIQVALVGRTHAPYAALSRGLMIDRLLNTLLTRVVDVRAMVADDGVQYERDGMSARMLRDVGVLLWELCQAAGGDLLTGVDAKMRINRAREWQLDGRGHGQHVASV